MMESCHNPQDIKTDRFFLNIFFIFFTFQVKLTIVTYLTTEQQHKIYVDIKGV